ncbi:heterokaryon incompatibility protein-domain-containing protein [Podospora didyma]|uniref:Heterokaryon incompatibility protein-domain-containing protein n=1 Tax=Podospora didyma TaxID=330526 RepID=A0AAE0NRU5_9PEZI|nr:heterokaryon incompatibility protein-domain-containing protein [Podospora didyma]
MLHNGDSFIMGPGTDMSIINPSGMFDSFAARAFAVTSNLGRALRAMKTDKLKALWVDAPCINQSNATERSQQVGLMRHIYENAGRVATWRDRFSSRFDGTRRKVGGTDVPDAVVQFLGLDRRDFRRANFCFEVVHCFHRIFSGPWFKRVWVLQEVASNKNVRVQLGDRFLSWRVLTHMHWYMRAIFIVPLTTVIDIADRLDVIDVKDMGSCWATVGGPKRRRLRLFKLVVETDDFLATDPRDKLYALLGISEEFAKSPVPGLLAPNYHLTPREVFINYTYWLITSSKNLNILSHIQWKSPGGLAATGAKLPSWVPDCAAPRNPVFSNGRSDLPHPRYPASKSVSVWSRLNRDGALVLKGFVRDDVQVLLPRDIVPAWNEEDGFYYNCEAPGRGASGRQPLLQAFWEFHIAARPFAELLRFDSGLDPNWVNRNWVTDGSRMAMHDAKSLWEDSPLIGCITIRLW